MLVWPFVRDSLSLQPGVSYGRERHNVWFSAFTLTVKTNFKFQLEATVYIKCQIKMYDFRFQYLDFLFLIGELYWTVELCTHVLMKLPCRKTVRKCKPKTKDLRNLYKDFRFYCNPPEIMIHTMPFKSVPWVWRGKLGNNRPFLYSHTLLTSTHPTTSQPDQQRINCNNNYKIKN